MLAAFYLPRHPWLWIVVAGGGALTLLGLYDLIQRSHSVRRNYPITGLLRWLFEAIRPQVRQYLIEGDNEQSPFSRSQRSLVYARAKNEGSERAFGTQLDVYESGYEFIAHSTRPAPPADIASFRVLVGGDQCAQPYSASIFNISALSFGSLSANAILALNQGARLGGFAQDTGEGSISRYHARYGGDLIWEIGSGYFGCRTADGNFDPAGFAAKAVSEQVKMVEIKLSQGAKPGHGGILPAAKVTREISVTRGVPMGEDCLSPARHRAFSTPIEMMHFIARLRELSGGKPVGFKLCVGHPWEFMAHRQGDAGDGNRPRFHRGRWRRGRHRRVAARIHESYRRAASRGSAVCAQHPRRSGASRSHPDRRRGQGRERVRHRCCSWRSAPTGPMLPGASCSQSAASSR